MALDKRAILNLSVRFEMKIFAYGSNMYLPRLNNRIKSAKFLAGGFVKQHKIAFHKISKDGSGKADCCFTGSNQDKIWGVIFEIADNEKSILDKYEGLGNGYNEKTVAVVCGDKSYRAQAYTADFKYIDNSLKPYDWYLAYLVKGAEEFCLPLSYIENVLKKTIGITDPNIRRRKKEYMALHMPNNDGLRMGGFTIGQWKSLREKLRRSTSYSSDWDQAVKWFKQRLNNRYFSPLNKISREFDFDGEGFTTTSILCVMIEHLAAVKEGKIYNHLQNGKSPKYEYKNSNKFYTEFLKREEIFKGYFYTEDGSAPPFCVDDFYKNVRCPLLHEACIKNNWKIKVSNNPSSSVLFVKSDENSKIIFRDVLLRIMTVYVDSYIEELKEDHSLRMNFARKMDSLCELPPDPKNYEWWIDK